MKAIFEPTKLKHLQVKNRLIRSATWDALASPEGFLTEEIYEIYRELAKGGVGTIVTGLTDVSPYNWALLGNTRMCSDSLIPEYKKLTDIVHEYDCKILVQLNMNEYMRHERHIIHVPINELIEADIKDLIAIFTEAAVRSEKAGFDGVQIHLAYGWLLNRFVNPVFNHRKDAYGECTENRVRLIKEIVESIRKATNNLHISTKFSFFDDENGECAVEEGIAICACLAKAGFDSIEIISANSKDITNRDKEACFRDLALAVKSVSDVPVILTGNNHDLKNMEHLLNEYGIEYFGLSRALIREPGLPNEWKEGREEPAKCISCSGCYNTYAKRCVFNKKNFL